MFDWLTNTKRMRALEREALLLRASADETLDQNKAVLAQIAVLRSSLIDLQERCEDLHRQLETVADQKESFDQRLYRAQEHIQAQQDRSSEESKRLADLTDAVRQLDYRLKAQGEEADKISAALLERIELARTAVKEASNPG